MPALSTQPCAVGCGAGWDGWREGHYRPCQKDFYLASERASQKAVSETTKLSEDFFFFFVRWHIILGPDSHDCGPGSGGAGIC